MHWFREKLMHFNLVTYCHQIGINLTPKENAFCQEIITSAIDIVQFDYDAMRNFLENKIDQNNQLRIFFLEKKINIIKDRWKRKSSQDNRKK